MSRDRDTGARLDALVKGVDWAPMGTNDGMDEALTALSSEVRERNPAEGHALRYMGGDGFEPPTPSV